MDPDPVSFRDPAALTSSVGALMHIMKSSIGTGILAMPSAFSNAGLVIGSIGVPVIGIITIHCMHLLVRCEEELCRRLSEPFLEFERVAESAFSVGPVALRRHSATAASAVFTFLCITQVGYCSCYALFAAESFSEIAKDFFHVNITTQGFLFMLFPVMLMANMIRSLPNLSYFSSLANVLQMVGLFYIFVNLVTDMPSASSVRAFAGWRTLPLFFGTAIYAFEGIGTVLPIKKGMKEPSHFGGWVGVLNTAMVVVACLYIGMGFFGFLKYGDQVKGNIAFNLPEGNVNTTVKLMFAVAIFMSYPLQMYVPISMIWPKIRAKFDLVERTEKYEMIEVGFRILMVLVTFVAAAVVPKLDLCISLVGAFCSSCLAWIFPPLFHTLTFWDDRQDMSPRRFASYVTKNTLIAVFGMIGFMTGTYCAMREVISHLTK